MPNKHLALTAGNWDDLNDFLGVSINNDGTLKAAPARYVIASDGTTVTGYDQHGATVVSNTDGGAVLTALLPTASSAGATIMFRNDGNIFPWGSVPALPKGITKKLLINANGSTVQLSTAGPRFLDLIRVADYDMFQNIEIADVVVDANNVDPGTNRHIIVGAIGTNGKQRLNYDRITLRRVRTINVPTPAAGSGYQIFNAIFSSQHLASSEGTQTTITNILCEDLDMQGGSVGVFVQGTSDVVTSGLGVNVFYDKIAFNRCRHDTLVVPTALRTDANFQIGGLGFGGKARISDCRGENSGDVAYEIDGCQDFVGRGNVAVDAWTDKFFCRNFRAPLDVGSQKNTWRDCYSESVSLDRGVSNTPSIDYSLGGDAATAGFAFGELALENCTARTASAFATPPNLAGINLRAGVGTSKIQFRRISVRDLTISYAGLAVTAGGTNPSFVAIAAANTGAVYDIDGLEITLAGTRTVGAGANTWRLLESDGTNYHCSYKRMRVSFAGLTGVTGATDVFRWIRFGGTGQTARILIDDVRAVDVPAGGQQDVIETTANLTIPTRMFVHHLDTSRLNGVGHEFTIDASHVGKILVRDVISQRSNANGGTVTAPAAMTGLVTATGKTVGTVTSVVPALVQFLQGSGAGITAIDFSTDAGVTYTNLLTQAGAAMPAGADLVLGPLLPDALIKVTFVTTQPTVNVVPVNP